MQNVKTEISKKEYLNYVSNPAAYRRERKERIHQTWIAGCGWYGVECHESNGRYFRVDQIGDSCD